MLRKSLRSGPTAVDYRVWEQTTTARNFKGAVRTIDSGPRRAVSPCVWSTLASAHLFHVERGVKVGRGHASDRGVLGHIAPCGDLICADCPEGKS